MTNAPDFLEISDGTKLAYRKVEGFSPTVIWCGGLKSDMMGSKAVYLDSCAKEQGFRYIRFDYFGHGESDGNFTEGTLSRWSADIISVIDKLCDDEVILVGSSMGGWASLLAALERKQRVKAMVLINPAPDFTEKLRRAKWGEAEEKALIENGVVYETSGYDEPYAYSKKLMDDGKAQQILDGPIALSCPIRIFQGSNDTVVPPAHSRLIVDAVESEDVTCTLVKGGDHSLSRAGDLRLISAALKALF